MPVIGAKKTRQTTDYLELQLEAERSLMRLQRSAELGVVVEIEPRRVGQAERGGCAGVRAVPAFANALHRDALGTEADDDRTEVLREYCR